MNLLQLSSLEPSLQSFVRSQTHLQGYASPSRTRKLVWLITSTILVESKHKYLPDEFNPARPVDFYAESCQVEIPS